MSSHSSHSVVHPGDTEAAPIMEKKNKTHKLRHAKVGLEILDIIATPEKKTCPLPVTMLLSLTVYVAACVVLITVCLHMKGETFKVTHIGHHMRYPESGQAHHNEKVGLACKSLSLMDQSYTFLDTVDGVAWGVDAFSVGMNNRGHCEANFNALSDPSWFAWVLLDSGEEHEGNNVTMWGACLEASDSYRPLHHLDPNDCEAMIRAASVTSVKNLVAIRAPRCSNDEVTDCYATAAEVQAAWALGDGTYRSHAHMRAFCDNFDSLPPYACSWDTRVHIVEALGTAWGFVDLIFVLSTIFLAAVSFFFAKAVDIRRHGFTKAVYMYLSFLGGVLTSDDNNGDEDSSGSDSRLRDLENTVAGLHAKLTRLELAASSPMSKDSLQPFAAAASSFSSLEEEKQHPC